MIKEILGVSLRFIVLGDYLTQRPQRYAEGREDY
jgi:hypothetical protein